ncbi:hypothetical protein ACFQ9X_51280 [Catenulispora yoronensis]
MTSSTKPGEGREGEGGADPSSQDAVAAEFARELTRVADGFRRLPHSKFALRLEPYGDRAQAGYWLASQLTLLAQGMERWDDPRPLAGRSCRCWASSRSATSSRSWGTIC